MIFLLGAIILLGVFLITKRFIWPLKFSPIEIVIESMPIKFLGCSGIQWPVKFRLKTPSPTHGWIIQKITVTSEIFDCQTPPNSLGFEDPVEFFEAWEVLARKDSPEESTPWDTDGDGVEEDFVNDVFAWANRDPRNKRGHVKTVGELYFFAGQRLPLSFRRPPPRGVFAGRNLHGSKTAPAFWPRSLPIGYAVAEHVLEFEWNCCHGAEAPPRVIQIKPAG